MSISFFIADTGEFYADMENSTVNGELFNWLGANSMELGRKSSFEVREESPVFNTLEEAEQWLSENWPSRFHMVDIEDDSESLADAKPTEEQYQACARTAHEINEIAALGELEMLLPFEDDHAYLCQVGIWYWSIDHSMLAASAYERSIEICPEAPTFFNLAVCCDDMGQKDKAMDAMVKFYKMVSSDEEKEHVEEILRNQGKEHLIRK